MTHYEILEVRENASTEVIRMAYKALCRKYHPDVCKEPLESTNERMQKINIAYETLSNPEMRRQYDITLEHLGNGASNHSSNGTDKREKKDSRTKKADGSDNINKKGQGKDVGFKEISLYVMVVLLVSLGIYSMYVSSIEKTLNPSTNISNNGKNIDFEIAPSKTEEIPSIKTEEIPNIKTEEVVPNIETVDEDLYIPDKQEYTISIKPYVQTMVVGERMSITVFHDYPNASVLLKNIDIDGDLINGTYSQGRIYSEYSTIFTIHALTPGLVKMSFYYKTNNDELIISEPAYILIVE